MKPAFKPKSVATKQPRGPRKTGVFPRYVSVGNAKKVDWTLDVCDSIGEHVRGRVMLDFDADGELIGVRIMG